ncbi:DUF3710 domain-containing protein [Rhodococcus sp. 14-2470-1a]|uniref:DUF3710 domain-containing protein n=1 Tax=Rhodococcus sp. 14-2470-1a TaxID=2023150 RepID=UPI000B9A5B9A|nr:MULTISPECIES: DUF3710 domain-containing protein [unclassified Rhodococcus (in: high G+C Gram-positive bacteria)]OZE98818.1 hypothetical protein CH300_23800 [Rhodococcus sp. 15-1154-1]OZF45184.1 hypothetical protein CH292_23555 [Rhodococcus sp. 14-2470-1a]
MFGRRKKDADAAGAPNENTRADDAASGAGGRDADEALDPQDRAADQGPFDLEELDEDRETLAATRLDLGSVLLPLPAGGQLQVEMTQAGAPQAVHVVTQYGRITIAAYAAPKSPGQWREVAADLAGSLRGDQSVVSVETGPWGRELHGVTANADLRFIGVDGYRWMVRCVLAGPSGAVGADSPLVAIARDVLSQTVVDRGSDPHPVRTPLPVVLPQALLAQLAAAQQQQQAAAQQAGTQQAGAQQAGAQQAGGQVAPQAEPPNPVGPTEGPRRGTSGSAMQQLG